MTRIVLLRDNARTHTPATTKKTIHDFRWELSVQPPYNPDLASSDYFSFLHFQRFENSEDLTSVVMNWLNFQVENFFAEGLKKLV